MTYSTLHAPGLTALWKWAGRKQNWNRQAGRSTDIMTYSACSRTIVLRKGRTEAGRQAGKHINWYHMTYSACSRTCSVKKVSRQEAELKQARQARQLYMIQDFPALWKWKWAGRRQNWSRQAGTSTDTMTFAACSRTFSIVEVSRQEVELKQAGKPVNWYHDLLCRTFSIVEVSKHQADWGRNWSASFYLDVKTSSYSYKVVYSIP